MMIQNLLHTRNLKLMNFHVSSPTNRTGNGMTFSLTTNNVMAKPSNLLSAESKAISIMNVLVLPAMLLNLTLLGMMVRKNPRFLGKICLNLHSPSDDNRFIKTHKLRCPHCSHILEPIKNRKHFIIHKCKNPKCSYVNVLSILNNNNVLIFIVFFNSNFIPPSPTLLDSLAYPHPVP